MTPSQLTQDQMKSNSQSLRSSTRAQAKQKSHERESQELREIEHINKDGDSDSGESGSYEIAPDSEGESESQMDDLMFALKTGVTSSQDDDTTPFIQEMETIPHKKPTSSEQYRLRRISMMADTHL